MSSPFANDVPKEATEEERMRALIESLSGYIFFYHGGSVEMQAFDGETLKVKFKGACEGCKLTPVTLHGWIEGTAKQFFPRLKTVEAV